MKITGIAHGKRREPAQAQIPTIILEGILINGQSLLISLTDLVGVRPMDLPTGTDLHIMLMREVIILIPMTKGRYPYVIDVRSWGIMLMNVPTPGNHKTMFLYVVIVKLQVILLMNALNLKRMRESGRQANMFEYKMIKRTKDLEM